MGIQAKQTATQAIRKRLFDILEPSTGGDMPSRVFDVFIIGLISLNVIAVILETVPVLSTQYAPLFATFELFSISIFTVEYLLRIWTCTFKMEFDRPVSGRIRFAATPLALIDLLSILPFYVPMVVLIDLRFIRILRLFRIFRLLKTGRYSQSMQTLGHVMKAKKEELVITVFIISVLLVFAASFMYLFEYEAQPEAFSSIPAAMWWGIATLTTVGYGDIYPITLFGKVSGAIIALLGIGIFALPTGILAAGFAEAIQRRHSEGRLCSHCGRDIDQSPETPSTTTDPDPAIGNNLRR